MRLKSSRSGWVMSSECSAMTGSPARSEASPEIEFWFEFGSNYSYLSVVLDEDINQPDRLARILMELGLPASDILDQAQAEPTKRRLREQTEQARARGIFGAPTFFVGTEMFWGNDRLDDALLFASERKGL